MTPKAALCAEADAGMRVELDAGRIPSQRREVVRAYLEGSVQEFTAAAELREGCVSAGEIAIPNSPSLCRLSYRGSVNPAGTGLRKARVSMAG